MFYINTTFIVERNRFDEFYEWLKAEYVGKAMRSGVFESHRVAQVLANEPVEDVSIACELGCRSLSEGMCWMEETGREICEERFGDNEAQLLYFTTVLKTIE